MRSIVQFASWTMLAALTACGSPAEEAKAVDTRAALVPVENTGMHERNLEIARDAKAHPDAQLVFLGDSITQGWSEAGRSTWELEFIGWKPLNLGVSGDRTEHVLWRLAQGEYDQLSPRVIVIMIGTNNTGHRMDPPADIAAGVKEILAQLHRRFPKTRLCLLSIFPRGETSEDPGRKNNDAANALLAGVARQAGVEWLDVSRAFLDAKGVLSKELMPDLLHPNTRGYEIWASTLRDSLKRWMP
ncbi:MAG TPA: GDSL-type esterase/lipase family protein [Planctomycetota bacterium]|nr:GDSL-type esterase/lipase family protein [Planctomycetota bacterium]